MALELVRRPMAQLAVPQKGTLITMASHPSFQGLLSGQEQLLRRMLL